MLFNIYSENIFQETLEKSIEVVVIDGEIFDKTKYPDDTVIIVYNLQDLQRLLKRLNINCKNYGIRMNFRKTKFRVYERRIQTAMNVSSSQNISTCNMAP